MNACVLIMAGGQGKRMLSSLPKVLHEIEKVPMLVMIVREAIKAAPKQIFIVVGEHWREIESSLLAYGLRESVQFVYQKKPLGTGHALQCSVSQLAPYAGMNLVILSGDIPCFSSEYIRSLGYATSTTMVTRRVSGNMDSGRVLLNGEKFERIVEMKDATEAERKVDLINCGVYSMAVTDAMEHAKSLNSLNAQNEYYITDMMEILHKAGREIVMLDVPNEDAYQLMGVNNVSQLESLRKEVRSRPDPNFQNLQEPESTLQDHLRCDRKMSNPLCIGEGDINPGGFGPGGGMYAEPAHPMFVGEDDEIGVGGPPDCPYVPGARFDPIFPMRGRRPPMNPDNDLYWPPS